jgi:hypothetical protein
MQNGWIAITGSAAPQRAAELKLKNPTRAERAAEAIGAALASTGFGILVYSSDPIFIEPPVVRGFVNSGKAPKDSIRVLYPRKTPPPTFPERDKFPECFQEPDMDPNPNWEFGFYRSLFSVDGVLLLGGGASTLAGGVVARLLRKPIAAIDCYGGAASAVWETLKPGEDLVTEADRNVMGVEDSSEKWATAIASSLLRQKQEAAARAAREKMASRRLNGQAAVILVAFLLAVAMVVLTWDTPGLPSWLTLAALLGAPLLAGLSGALVRGVWETVIQGLPQSRPAATVGVLGIIAGGVAGMLFVVAQLAALAPAAGGQLPPQVNRLIPLALLTGFSAGFATDVVFSRLRESPPMEGVTAGSLSQIAKTAVQRSP